MKSFEVVEEKGIPFHIFLARGFGFLDSSRKEGIMALDSFLSSAKEGKKASNSNRRKRF